MANAKVTHAEFLADRLGANWVLVHARRKEPRYDRAGNLQNQVTQKRFKEVERDYRTRYGDPYDAVRAELYQVLLAVREAGTPCRDLLDRVDAALEAEACAR